MTSPKVSVLIPTYNYARYLPEAIESVLGQDWRDLELLISDDCSTDASREVIARYAAKDSRIRFQIHPANLGMVRNWNWCLSEARGEYVKFLFGDDKLASREALGKLLQLLETNASVALAASARYVVGEDSAVLETWDDFRQPGVHSGTEVIARCLAEDRNLVGEPSAVLFRRRDAARGFDLHYQQVVDLEMWFHLLEKGGFAYTREPLCCFRKHARQQTEINKTGQIGEKEAVRLFGEYYGKPYLRSKGFRARLFSRIYDLRKRRKRGAHMPQGLLEMERDLSAHMSRSWYAVYWSRRRITRPFQNVERWLNRRWLEAPPGATSDSGQTKGTTALAREASIPSAEPARQGLQQFNAAAQDFLADVEAPQLTELELRHSRLIPSRELILPFMPKGGVCAEVGTQTGYFAKLILSVLQPVKLHIFDIDFTPFDHVHFQPAIQQGIVQLHQGDSATLLSTLPDRYFDFIYVDAGHSYASVVRDLEQVALKIKEGGWIVCNDYTLYSPLDGPKYGVYRAVNEFCLQRGYQILYLGLHRWGYHDVALKKRSSST